MIKKLIIISIIIALGVAGYFLLIHQTEEEIIKETVTKLAQYASKNDGQKTTTMILNNQALQKLFAEKVSINFGINYFNGEYSNLGIVNSITQANAMLKSSSLKANDILVTIITPTAAKVEFTGSITATSKSNERVNEVRVLNADLIKNDNKWQFTSIKFREVLQK